MCDSLLLTHRWVHVECLQRWRRTSTNPNSFYRCDMCHYEYKFAKVFNAYASPLTLARWIGKPGFTIVLSVLILVAMIFVLGFFYTLFTPGASWGDVLNVFRLQHYLGGSIILGLGSLVGWVGSLCAGGGGGYWGGPRFGYYYGGFGGGGGRGDGKAAAICLAIMVVVGLVIALTWIYGRVSKEAEKAARKAQDRILEIEPEAPSRPQEKVI